MPRPRRLVDTLTGRAEQLHVTPRTLGVDVEVHGSTTRRMQGEQVAACPDVGSDHRHPRLPPLAAEHAVTVHDHDAAGRARDRQMSAPRRARTFPRIP
jgi:hypothetical protein